MWYKDDDTRSSHQEMFLGKGVLKICSEFTGEYPCRSAISIKLLYNFIEVTLRHECSPVNLLHIFRTLFSRNTSEWLLLNITEKPETVHCEYFYCHWKKNIPHIMSKYINIQLASFLLNNFYNTIRLWNISKCSSRLQI